ncbi:MAG: DUF2493 domain-containing protein [Methanobacterium sp.]
MRTIIAGGRDFVSYDLLKKAVTECGWRPTVVISGGAKGADFLGERWAKENNVPCEVFPADWNKYGRKAGPIRNIQMAENAEALIALWDGESRGTKHMIDTATRKGLKVYIQYY